jgi:hypothetical protein
MAQHHNGLALVFARTETRAMQAALKSAHSVYFLAGRICFLEGFAPHRQGKSAGAPSMLLAWGKEATHRLQSFARSRAGILYQTGALEVAA